VVARPGLSNPMRLPSARALAAAELSISKDAARKPLASRREFLSGRWSRPSQTAGEQDAQSRGRPNWASRGAHEGGRGPLRRSGGGPGRQVCPDPLQVDPQDSAEFVRDSRLAYL
jgi:hypothetical protein